MKRTAAGIVFAALTSISASGATAGSCRPDFIAAAEYTGSAGTETLFAGDLNGDGLPDLVAMTNMYSENIWVRLAQADGNLGPAIEKATSDYPYAGALGAFGAGSGLNLVITRQSGIDVYAGNGDGTFADPLHTPGTFLNRVSAAHLDDDGDLDLVGTSYFDGRIVALLGNGDGTFQAPIETDPATSPNSVAVGDLDGDDRDDLVVAGGGNFVDVYRGLGDGHFAEPTQVIVGVAPSSPRLVDLDGGGDLDLVLVTNGFVGVLLGNGDGTFQASVKYYGGPNPGLIVPADFSGDALMDVGVFNLQAGSLWLLNGTGGGALTPGPRYFATLGASTAVAADFGDDGRMDVAASGSTTVKTAVLSGTGGGALRAVPYSPLSNYGSQGFAYGDFDEDGFLDLADGDGDSVEIFLGSGAGAFTPGEDYLYFLQIQSIGVGRFDADGHDDLAIGFTSIPEVRILLGNGDGTFREGVTLTISSFSNFFPAFEIADFDGDAVSDIAAASQDAGTVGGAISIFLGEGDGTFGPEVPAALSAYPTGLAAADFDGDGLADLAVPTDDFPSYGLEIFLSEGDGTMTPSASYPLSASSDSIVAGAFLTGGPADLVVGSQGETNVRLFTGQGNGTFSGPVTIGLGNGTYDLGSADFDGDGNLDLVAASTGDVATTMRGIGNGAFQSPVTHAVGQGPLAVLAADFDGNGLNDAVFKVVTFNVTAATTLLNGGLGVVAADAVVLVGSPAVLEAQASGFGVLSYQWRKNGEDLVDGGPVSGPRRRS